MSLSLQVYLKPQHENQQQITSKQLKTAISTTTEPFALCTVCYSALSRATQPPFSPTPQQHSQYRYMYSGVSLTIQTDTSRLCAYFLISLLFVVIIRHINNTRSPDFFDSIRNTFLIPLSANFVDILRHHDELARGCAEQW